MWNISERTLERSNVGTKWKFMKSPYSATSIKTLFYIPSRKIAFIKVSDSKGRYSFSSIGN